MNFKLGFIIVLTVLITFISLGVIGMMMEDTTPSTPVAPLQAEPVQVNSEAWAKDVFMEACNDGTLESYCSCMWTQMRTMYSVEEIADMGNTGVYDQTFYDLVDYCIGAGI